MSVTSGFFNSLNGDRRYSAEQFSGLFKGIMSDGVFANVGDGFAVKPTGGFNVTVGPGKAWFDGIWIENDSEIVFTVKKAISGTATFTIFFEIDTRESVRNATIKILNTGGGLATNDDYPKGELINNDEIHSYKIAEIKVSSTATEINPVYHNPGDSATTGIWRYVGSSECPYISGLFQTHTIDTFVNGWDVEFHRWLESLQSCLDENTATTLANSIVNLENKYDTVQNRRLFFRGKNLGSTVTTSQLVHIQDGTFEDLYLGDYWYNNGVKWRIVDFDYWWMTGDMDEDETSSLTFDENLGYSLQKHHLVVMPDSTLTTAAFHTSSANTGIVGYAGCDMRVTTIASLHETIEAVFPDMIITHRELLSDGLSAYGYLDSIAWYDTYIELPSEIMMYGTTINSDVGDGTYRQTVNKTQLALFSLVPHFILADGIDVKRRQWLRDNACANTSWTFIDHGGDASYTKITNSRGVRPVFAIG